MSNAAVVTDQTFQKEVLESDLPVMVDMWAPWCGPCRMVGPVIEELAASNAGRIKVCKMNVDECPDTATKYGISAIPTVMFFKDGKEVEDARLVGVQPRATYQKIIDTLTTGQ